MDEILELRRWRHDLEGHGIMSAMERIKALEDARHQEALKNVEFRITITTLKEGMAELSNTIRAFHGDLATLRRLFVGCICLITLSILLPPEIIINLINFITKFV